MELNARFFVKLYLLLTIVFSFPSRQLYLFIVQANTNRICSGLIVPET